MMPGLGETSRVHWLFFSDFRGWNSSSPALDRQTRPIPDLSFCVFFFYYIHGDNSCFFFLNRLFCLDCKFLYGSFCGFFFGSTNSNWSK